MKNLNTVKNSGFSKVAISGLIRSSKANEPAISTSARQSVPKHLLKTANLKDITIYMIQEWVMIITTWLALAVSPSWVYPIGVLVICGRFNALGALLHDACHLKRSNSIYVTLIDWLGGYPIGLSIEGMRYHHLRHHRYACSHLDPYLKLAARKNSFMRLSCYLRGLLVITAWLIRPYFGMLALVNPKYKNGYAKVFFGDKDKKDLSRSKQIDLCIQRDLGQILYQSVIIYLTIIYSSWMLLYYIVPLLCGSVLNSYRVVEEHVQEVTNNRSPLNIVKLTKDQPANAFLRFFFFPRNIGFHRMHHLHPTVRYENLPQLNQWYADYSKSSENANQS